MNHPVKRSLAPWTTKSECYWMFLTLRELPKGVYDALESPCLGAGDFKGGLGIIIVVRYKETPVGKYGPFVILSLWICLVLPLAVECLFPKVPELMRVRSI